MMKIRRESAAPDIKYKKIIRNAHIYSQGLVGFYIFVSERMITGLNYAPENR